MVPPTVRMTMTHDHVPVNKRERFCFLYIPIICLPMAWRWRLQWCTMDSLHGRPGKPQPERRLGPRRRLTSMPPSRMENTYGRRGRYDAGDATFRTCFTHVSRCFARFTQGITHVSRMFHACFTMFRGVSRDSLMILGFAIIRDVSHMFRACCARFAQGITHVSRMFRACFAGVKHG